MAQRRNKIYFLSVILVLASCTLAFAQGCPTIEIISPAGLVSAGDAFTVHTDLKNTIGVTNLKYNWTTSLGTIIGGQGTASAVVQTSKEDAATNISIKVSIEGLSTVCKNTATDIVSVAAIFVCGLPADEFTTPSVNELRARVDNIFIQLNNNPNTVVLFEMEFSEGEQRSERTLRITRILNAIKFRKYDLSKVVFLISGDDKSTATRARILPLSADMTTWIKQGDLVYGHEIKQKLFTLFKDN